MSLDGESARRDETPAVRLIRNALRSAMCGTEARDLAIAHFDALLAEFERAEKKRLDDTTLAAQAMASLVENYEARLAKVPALVEALEWYADWAQPDYYTAEYHEQQRKVDAALTEWESEPSHAPSKPRPSSTG